jgi:hypothetical protein
MFASFGQPAAGMASSTDGYTLYMGVIRPGLVFSISGYTRYYKTPFYPVPNSEMSLTDGQIRTTLTDINGYYSFDALPGFLNYTVTPNKINSTQQTAITSYDAALILRHVVGMITLDYTETLKDWTRLMCRVTMPRLTGNWR